MEHGKVRRVRVPLRQRRRRRRHQGRRRPAHRAQGPRRVDSLDAGHKELQRGRDQVRVQPPLRQAGLFDPDEGGAAAQAQGRRGAIKVPLGSGLDGAAEIQAALEGGLQEVEGEQGRTHQERVEGRRQVSEVRRQRMQE